MGHNGSGKRVQKETSTGQNDERRKDLDVAKIFRDKFRERHVFGAKELKYLLQKYSEKTGKKIDVGNFGAQILYGDHINTVREMEKALNLDFFQFHKISNATAFHNFDNLSHKFRAFLALNLNLL